MSDQDGSGFMTQDTDYMRSDPSSMEIKVVIRVDDFGMNTTLQGILA